MKKARKTKKESCAQLIRRIRLSACMTQKEFAAEIGSHTLSVTFYETGLRKPSIAKTKRIIAFAKDLGILLTFFDFK